VTLPIAARLRALQLGDDLGRGLGVEVERSRLALLMAAMGLAGAGTAAAGPWRSSRSWRRRSLAA
jgi:iron complex transport system permease protein